MYLEYIFGVWERREFKMSKVTNINELYAYYQFVDIEGMLNLSNVN